LRRGGFLPDFPGMLHGAAACSGDPAWETAFIRSRIGKKWGFLPSQIGLRSNAFAVYQREQALVRRGRVRTALPCKPSRGPDDSLLCIQRGKCSPDERRALREHMFMFGREAEEKSSYSPSIGKVRRTYVYGARPRFFGTYLGSLKLCKIKDRRKLEKEEAYALPVGYVSMKERIRDIHSVDADGTMYISA